MLVFLLLGVANGVVALVNAYIGETGAATVCGFSTVLCYAAAIWEAR